MLINSIEMEYFFRIYNSGKIEFSVDKDKNVTVIKGDNGTGKTTMLSAFSWVFYGVVEDPLVVDKMINKRRLYEMQNGDIETAGVKVSISDSGHDYILSRYQKFKKVDANEAVRVGDPDFSVIDINNPSVPIADKNFFDSIIPDDLKGFFFFDGERIDRLAKIDGRDEIKKAILDILGLTTLERIETAVSEIQSEYNKKIKAASKSETLKSLRQDFEDLGLEIDKDKKELNGTDTEEGVTAQKKHVEQQIDNYKNFLKEHNADAVKALQNKRESLETKKTALDEEKDRLEKETMRHISKEFKYFIISDRFNELSDFLEEKRKKKELPSDIKLQFVKDLLSSGECICGQKLVEGECFHTNIKKLLETAGREELDNAYITMRAFIDSNEINDTVSNFYELINENQNKELNCTNQIEEIDKEIKQIGTKLSNDFGDAIKNYEAALETAEAKKLELAQKEYYLIAAIKANEAKKKAIEAKIKIEEGKQGNKDMFSEAFNMAVAVGELNEEIRRLFVDITREDMDAKIKSVFADLSRKDDREAVLNENFQLMVVNKTSKQQQILSTGERQVTSLAFIGALVSYSKEKINSDLITDFSGGDFPIVMDSSFGNLDPTHKANVAKGLPKLASQVIIITSDAQWKGTVEDNIAERVKTIYNMQDGKYDGNDDEYTEFGR